MHAGRMGAEAGSVHNRMQQRPADRLWPADRLNSLSGRQAGRQPARPSKHHSLRGDQLVCGGAAPGGAIQGHTCQLKLLPCHTAPGESQERAGRGAAERSRVNKHADASRPAG